MPYYIKRTKAKKKDKPLPLFDKAGITVKKKPDLKAKLDKEFSLFIRLRDAMPNGYFRCISCGQIKPFTQADCGHYFSRTHLATRFDENNCHAECRHCNRFKADHLEGYRVNLIAKIGQQKIDMYKLRDYQQKASDAAVSFFNNKAKKTNAIMVLPTGSGKSLIIADIAARLDGHTLVFQPSKEILEQNFKKLCSYGILDCSIYSACHHRQCEESSRTVYPLQEHHCG